MTPDKPTALPVDTTAGGAAKLANVKSFKKSKDISDINALRISPTIARQELLSYMRMLIRDCFQGQLPDPFIHMEHSGDITTPARFWVNKQGVTERPTISYTKARLMGQTIPELWPDLMRMAAYYWLYSEGQPFTDVDETTVDFQRRHNYIKEHADPRFIRGDGSPVVQDDARSERRSDNQKFVDDFLRTLPLEELKWLCAKNVDLATVQRQTRGDIYDRIREAHAALQNTLPQALRAVAPPTQMIRKRAEDIYEERTKPPT